MAFFMDIIRDSRRGVAGRNDAGIAQWTGAPVGDVLPGQDAAAVPPGSEPKPRKPGVRSARRRQTLTDEAGNLEGIQVATREIPAAKRAPEPGRRSSEAASLPSGRRDVQTAPPASVTQPIAPGHEPPAVQRKLMDSSPAAAQPQAPPRGRDAVPGSSDPAGHELPSRLPGRVSVAPGALEGLPVVEPPPRFELSSPSDMPVSRAGAQIAGQEPSPAAAPPAMHMVVREAAPGERVSINEGAVEAQSAAPIHGRPAAMAGVRRRGDSSPESGPPVVRIGQVNVIVESAREARKPKASAAQGEDLASRTFLRSL